MSPRVPTGVGFFRRLNDLIQAPPGGELSRIETGEAYGVIPLDHFIQSQQITRRLFLLEENNATGGAKTVNLDLNPFVATNFTEVLVRRQVTSGVAAGIVPEDHEAMLIRMTGRSSSPANFSRANVRLVSRGTTADAISMAFYDTSEANLGTLTNSVALDPWFVPLPIFIPPLNEQNFNLQLRVATSNNTTVSFLIQFLSAPRGLLPQAQ